MQVDTSLLPVRGNDTGEILINDHEVIKQLLGKLTHSSGAQERTKILEQLKGVLTIHNATEENLVYPALNKVAGKGRESQKLYHETAEADTLMFEVDTALKEGDNDLFTEKAQKLNDAILEHIEDEEQSAIPDLDEGASEQEAAMLTASVREFRKSIHFETAGV